ELYDLARRQGVEPLEGLGYAAAAVIPFATVWAKGSTERWAEPAIFAGALWLVAVLTTATFARGPERRPLTAVAVTVFGVLYASALLAFTVAIRLCDHSEAHPLGSTALVAMPRVLTVACSTGSIRCTSWSRSRPGSSSCSAWYDPRRRHPRLDRIDRHVHAAGAAAPARALPRGGAHRALERGAAGRPGRRMASGLRRDRQRRRHPKGLPDGRGAWGVGRGHRECLPRGGRNAPRRRDRGERNR